MTKKEFETKYTLIAPSENILRIKVPMFDKTHPTVDPQALGID